MSLDDEIHTKLQQWDVVPLLGGLVPEHAAARLINYAPSYLRRQAAAGLSPLPYVRLGNRRFYKVADISRLLTKTVQ